MRVCMIAPDTIIDRRILQEAKSLVDRGNEVLVIVSWWDGDPVEHQIIDGVNVHRLKFDGFDPRMYWAYRFAYGANNLVAACILRSNNTIANILKYALIHSSDTISCVSDRLWDRELRMHRMQNRVVRAIALTTRVFNKLVWLAGHGSAKVVGAVGWTISYLVGSGFRGLFRLLPLLQRALTVITGYNGYDIHVGRVAAEHQYDVYQAHDLPALPAAAWAAAKWKAKLVYDAHELYPEISTLTKPQQLYLGRQEHKLFPKPDIVITVNESIADEMAKRYRGRRPHVIQNCPSPPNGFQSGVHYPQLRAKLSVDDDVKIVLFQGWMCEGRGLENLVKAAGLLKTPSALIVLMGYGDYRNTLADLANQNGAAHRVRFPEAVPQAELLYHSAGADLGIIPYQPVDLNSRYCTPNKLYEFVVAGIPILASDLPELRRLVVGEQVGMVGDLSTAEGMARMIDEAFSDPERLARWRAASVKVSRKYGWEEEQKKFLALYATLGLDDEESNAPTAGDRPHQTTAQTPGGR